MPEVSIPAGLAALDRYAAAVGLAFQVVDDILDVTADTATLGKTAGKDAANDKPTYVSLMGLDAARGLAPVAHRCPRGVGMDSAPRQAGWPNWPT